MDVDDDMEDGAGVGAGVRCEVCGSTQFSSQGGFFFCEICQTQSQATRQYVEREEFTPGQGHRRITGVLREKSQSNRERIKLTKEKLICFEGFNCYIKLITHRLVKLGFPPIIKDTVFDLWTKYLVRRKAIFVSKTNSTVDCYKSMVNKAHGKDCNCWPHKLKRCKRPVLKKKKKTATERVVQEYISANSRRRRSTKARMKALAKEYESHAESLFGEPSQSSTSEAAKQILKRRACKLTKHSRLVVNSMKKSGLQSMSVIHGLLKPELCTMRSVVTIVFISLRLIGCPILLTDVIRLIWNGTLYFTSLRLIFGESAKAINSKIDRVFTNDFINYISIDYDSTIKNMLLYLGISDFPYPQIQEFLPKFIDDFVLPRELECLIIQMQKLMPITNEEISKDRRVHNYTSVPEYGVFGLIILVLKLLFGFDDVTERYQSEFARTVNRVLEKKINTKALDWGKAFVVEDWLRYLRRRNRVFENEMFNPFCYRPLKKPSPHVVNQIVKVYGGHKGKNYERIAEEHNRKEAQSMFAGYARMHSTSRNAATTIPHYTNINYPQEETLQQYKARHPKVLNPDYETNDLVNNFTKTRIDCILNPTKYATLLKKAGYEIKVLEGDARQHKNLEELESKYLLVFQPFRSFDDHVPNSFSNSFSFNFLCNLIATTLDGTDNATKCRQRLEYLTRKIFLQHRRLLKTGYLKIFPYDLSDDEAYTVEPE